MTSAGQDLPGPRQASSDMAAGQSGQSANARPGVQGRGQASPRAPVGRSGRPAAEQHAVGQPTAEQPAAARPAAPGPPGPEQSREDTDIAWGDYPGRDDEDRLYRDRPPHWADY